MLTSENGRLNVSNYKFYSLVIKLVTESIGKVSRLMCILAISRLFIADSVELGTLQEKVCNMEMVRK